MTATATKRMTRAEVLYATDCHARLGCQCNGLTAATFKVAPAIVQHVLPAVVAWLAEHTGDTPEQVRADMVFSAPAHEESTGFTIALEGAYEWPIYVTAYGPNAVTEAADAHGIFLEPATGWSLGVYPAFPE